MAGAGTGSVDGPSVNEKRRTRLCIIISPSFGLTVSYGGQLQYLQSKGFDVTAVSSPGPEHELVRAEGISTCVVPIERRPSPIRDLVAMFRIWWFLLFHRFDIVMISSPKAALLGAIACFLTAHYRVVYMVRGRPYEHMTGLKRKVMNACEWLACRLSRVVIPVSRELGDLLVRDGICPRRKITIIGRGSSNGVDVERFRRTDERTEAGRSVRQELGIADDDVLILFAGWLRGDKGTNELVRAFARLGRDEPGAHLVLMGRRWSADPLDDDVAERIDASARIHHLAWREDPVPQYMAADILVLPTWREGFPRVALEGAIANLPVIATDIHGCREAIVNGETGLLFPLRDEQALHAAMRRLVTDPALRKRLGDYGRRWAEENFRQEIIWEGTVELYRRLYCPS